MQIVEILKQDMEVQKRRLAALQASGGMQVIVQVQQECIAGLEAELNRLAEMKKTEKAQEE